MAANQRDSQWPRGRTRREEPRFSAETETVVREALRGNQNPKTLSTQDPRPNESYFSQRGRHKCTRLQRKPKRDEASPSGLCYVRGKFRKNFLGDGPEELGSASRNEK